MSFYLDAGDFYWWYYLQQRTEFHQTNLVLASGKLALQKRTQNSNLASNELWM